MLKEKLKENAETVEAALSGYLKLGDSDYGGLIESMRYSAFAGGKRIRAFLCAEFYKLSANTDDLQAVLPVACAIEMVHIYSLIHDDLPCMDDDDFRRGRPSNHKKFGEAAALLAGDALLTCAFEIIAEAPHLSDEKKARIISLLARAAGRNGMIGGQFMDIMYAGGGMDIVRLIKMYTLKTAALVAAAAKTGCIAGGADEAAADAAMNYAVNIGLAFQVIDDILDNQNALESPLEYAKSLTAKAVLWLEELKKTNKEANTATLEGLAEYLLERTD